MSTFIYSSIGRICASALVTVSLACFSSGVRAQSSKPEDLLNRAKSDQAVLTQRIQAKLMDAVDNARKLQPVSPVRAANVLKTALLQLDDPLIPPTFKNEWVAKISTQIKAIESGQKISEPAEINPVKREIKDAELKRAKAIQEEYYEVRRGVDTISALIKSGNSTQANKEIEALLKRYPDNPAALQLAENSSMNQRLADARVLVEQQKQGYYMAMRSLDKSNVMPKGDVDFDAARFREITKLRVKPALTKKEQEILKALDSPINIGYKDAPFEEVIKAISNATGLNILLDKNALQSAMIDSNTPTSVTLRGAAARTALRKVLQDHNLTFIIQNESIQVVTLEKAREMLVTRVYYVGDLVQLNGPFSGAVRWGPWMDMMQTQENISKLVEMIKSVDPTSWQGNGGIGSVTFNGPSMSLIVRQTAEVHARLSGSLGR